MFTQAISKEDSDIFSVSSLNQVAKSLLEENLGSIWVKGEISNLTMPRSGHIYFTLKDEKSQIRCAMFKGSQKSLNSKPEDGQKVLVQGNISLYVPRGDYQLIAQYLEPAGIGDLKLAFEALKKKLLAEGLFKKEDKQALPKYPCHIGVITSPTGAVICDIKNVLKRRYPIAKLFIYPTEVQGKAATDQIVQAIKRANKLKQVDTLVIARGGGSLEDLWCFNEETVARAIHASKIPIVSAIGHETDFTIADFVADLRAPTPSAAAELITPDTWELQEKFKEYQQKFKTLVTSILQQHFLHIDHLEKRLVHPRQQLITNKQRLQEIKRSLELNIKLVQQNKANKFSNINNSLLSVSPIQTVNAKHKDLVHLKEKLVSATENIIQRKQNKFASTCAVLDKISPLATLQRGYAIVSPEDDANKVITDAKELTTNQSLKTQLKNGFFISVISKIDIEGNQPQCISSLNLANKD